MRVFKKYFPLKRHRCERFDNEQRCALIVRGPPRANANVATVGETCAQHWKAVCILSSCIERPPMANANTRQLRVWQ